MHIAPTQKQDADRIAKLVSKSNKDVADLFKLHIHNAPKHPSFCTPEWVLADIERGEKYFIFSEKGVAKGCVAFEQPDENTAYLNRLSVLPEYRHNGIGSKLVDHIFCYSKDKNITLISIGIIAEHTQLKEWYLKRGFELGSIQKFSHLPFDVLYMQYKL